MEGSWWKAVAATSAACVLVLCTHSCRSVDEAAQAGRRSSASHVAEPHGDASAGACSRADRKEHVHDANLRFVGHIRDCSKQTWANKAKNVECLAKAVPTLSKACAGCFADMASCALANCKFACLLSSTGERCTKCANSNCQASLVRCTGVARADLP